MKGVTRERYGANKQQQLTATTTTTITTTTVYDLQCIMGWKKNNELYNGQTK